MKWRILLHERSPASGLDEIDHRWCIDDVCTAHTALDEIDEAQRRALDEAKANG